MPALSPSLSLFLRADQMDRECTCDPCFALLSLPLLSLSLSLSLSTQCNLSKRNISLPSLLKSLTSVCFGSSNCVQLHQLIFIFHLTVSFSLPPPVLSPSSLFVFLARIFACVFISLTQLNLTLSSSSPLTCSLLPFPVQLLWSMIIVTVYTVQCGYDLCVITSSNSLDGDF